MGQSMLMNKVIKNTAPKKWIEVSCKFCNMLLSFNHFSCQDCESNFCLKCYKKVISISKCCTYCNSNLTKIIKIQESVREYQSALIICEFSHNGCKTILPFNEISIHKLKCKFNFLKYNNKNSIIGCKCQILNKCQYIEASCPQCKLAVLIKKIDKHNKLNFLNNLASCLFCKIKISNESRIKHIQFCKMNLNRKECKLSLFDKHRSITNKSLKKIEDSVPLNADKNKIIKNEYDDFNNLARQFISFNFSKLKNSNFFQFKHYKSSKNLIKIKENKKLFNNYYLFYFEYKRKNLYIKNMKSSEIFLRELYYSYHCVDASFHQNSIFLCGGYDKDYLNTCEILDLESKTTDKSIILSEKKSGVALLSTGIILFCLGGYNNKYLNTCEYFNKGKLQWNKINPLNNCNQGITSSFDSQKYIYTFGGDNNRLYERYDSTILTIKWEILNVSKASKRFYGNCFLLNNAQFILFGGGFTKFNNFYLFNINSQKLEKLNTELKISEFVSSKPLYFEGFIWSVETYYTKRFSK